MRESTLQGQINWLNNYLQKKGKLQAIRRHGTPRIIKGRRVKNSSNGEPDVQIQARGRTGYAELKVGKNGLTQNQIDFRDRAKLQGCLYCVPRSLNEYARFLEQQMGVSLDIIALNWIGLQNERHNR